MENDRSGPDETDAAHDLRRNAARIEPQSRLLQHGRKAVLRHDHQQRAAHRDEKVRTESRLFHAVLAIEPDHEPEDPCQQKSENKNPSHITTPFDPRRQIA